MTGGAAVTTEQFVLTKVVLFVRMTASRFHHTLWAIEAKANGRVTDHDAASLLAAKAYLPKNTRPVIVIPADPSRRLGCGVEVLALTDLLSAMAVL